jgi:hypothetical protein
LGTLLKILDFNPDPDKPEVTIQSSIKGKCVLKEYQLTTYNKLSKKNASKGLY